MRTKVGWGFGGMADTYAWYGLTALAMPIYNIGYGVDSVLVGYALAIPRVVDAVTDPLMGNISDNTRTRWGRRRPYVMAGAILCAILFPLLWMPPFASDGGKFGYFLTMLVLFALGYTVFSVPYTALGYEFTTDYDEKTRALAWKLYIGVIAGFTIQWLYKLTVLDIFGGDETVGIKYVSVAVALVILGTGIMPAIVCREKAFVLTQQKISLKAAFGSTFKNRPFGILMIAYVIILTALQSVGSLGLYVNIFYVAGGDKSMAGTIGGVFGSVMIVSSLAGMKLVGKISEHTSKRRALMIGLGLGVLGNVVLWYTMKPEHPYLQVIAAVFLGMGIQGAWLMIDSMVADVCDEDEVRTGVRREGMYGAVKGFAQKAALSVTSVLSGYALAIAGYEESVEPSLAVVIRMKAILIGSQMVGLTGGVLLVLAYPLSRARAERNRTILLERHPERVSEGVQETE